MYHSLIWQLHKSNCLYLGGRILNLYGNTAKYYDLESVDFQNVDLQFYESYAGEINNNILEIGCGTGRVTLWFAQKGYHITGVDLSCDMLEQLEKKIKPDTNSFLTILHADMSDFKIDQKFQLVIAPDRVLHADYI